MSEESCKQAYITAAGAFLPGEPIGNDEMEEYLGYVGGKPSRTKTRILRENGIKTRHYAIDRGQNTTYSNTQMAALAIRDAIGHSGVNAEDIDYLSTATTHGDVIIPGFSSMVQAEAKLPAMEIASLHGVCGSGVAAIQSAFLQIKAGGKKNAIACASEFPSRIFKSSRYESQRAWQERGALPFDTDFLRFMLSDGAGAFLIQDKPAPNGLSLRIEWIEIKSYANQYETCMYAGANKEVGEPIEKSWLDYATYQEAADDGAINMKQDIRLVKEMPKLGVNDFFKLVDEGKVKASDVDWMACHYSSHFFRDEVFRLLELGGASIPEEKWFTNLYEKGNTGSASIFILLEELLNGGRLKENEKILCMVPESGRFLTTFMYLTVVRGGSDTGHRAHAAAIRQPKAPALAYDEANSLQEWLVRQLVQVWLDFENRLNHVPLIEKLNRGRFTLEDYKRLLFNLRQQVVDGSQWIARAASNISIDRIDLRSAFIAHASDEHKDYQILERDYLAIGGTKERIQSGSKNIGSEALSAYMFQRASRENPFDLLGAMWIIEGLGCRMARHWGELIRDQLRLPDEKVSFLLYHSESDVNHFERLEKGIRSEMLTEEIARSVVKTAKVTARLYLLQLEELENE
ncbi:StlD/DarB family beta-ketosynthase [Cohnella endophytica]|uniref:StlD/DarB family beta-ketosynthase n=1 Tax=Cohnella endophytica TaxID=2419778 RepID=A0A494Y4X3_9BACL|nr:StlD/DarB family beta-ketosynthase [Cohnella endophytica]RKP57321.1 StlD/DarB family beta-ketosynthase [Cohnella endophytica]